jgi:hypothetical protein
MEEIGKALTVDAGEVSAFHPCWAMGAQGIDERDEPPRAAVRRTSPCVPSILTIV